MMGQCINCNTLVVKMKTEMQEILMDHVKIISRIQKFVSTTEATSLSAIPDETIARQEKDFHQNEEDEIISVETDQEENEDIYECEKCNKTFENVHVLGKHLEMYYQKKHLSNDLAVNENNASNQNEQEVSWDNNDIESNQNDIEGAADEQVIDDDNNINSDQSEIDEQEIEINASNQNEQQ